MKHNTLGAVAAAAAFALIPAPTAMAATTFETVVLPVEGYWNGSDGSGGFTLDGAVFHNNYNNTYGSWNGFAVSNHTDTTTAGYANQYSAYPGSGAGASAQYSVGYYASYTTSTIVNLASLTSLTGLGASFTNTTYAALDMLNGSGFSKKFGGVDGTDADWFLLTIEGFAGASSTGTVDFYLADYRSGDPGQDYIVDSWTHVDFTSLGSVDKLSFSLTSSDNGDYGMNTPAYFAMDNFLAVPEPSSVLMALSGLVLLARRKR